MRSILPPLLLLIVATPALALDGVLEINQTCAVETGCFAGDAAGFPVTIPAAGSYRLTSNLSVAKAGVSAIEVVAERVSLDLNGFSVTICVGVICGIGEPVTAINGAANELRIFNGIVKGATNWGITVGLGAELRNLTVEGCEYGIAADLGSRLIDVTVRNARKTGVSLGEGSLMARSTVSQSGEFGVEMSLSALIVNSVIQYNQGAIKVLGSGVAGRRGGYRESLIVGNGCCSEVQPIEGTVVDLGGNVCGTDTTCP